MPIWLRNFTFKNIKDYTEKAAEKHKKSSPKTKQNLGPNIKPSFSVKGTKK
jgi:hypothetical protein